MPLDKNSPVSSEQGVYSPFSFNQKAGDVVEGPGLVETVKAAVQKDNTIGSYVASEKAELSGIDQNRVEPGYNPFKNGDLEGYEEFTDRFLDAPNSLMVEAIKSDIDREKKNRETIEAAGWGGTAAEFGASLLDWPSLLPGGAAVRSGRLGFSVARSAASIGAASGVGAGFQEGALHMTQQTRTGQESALVVGGSVILGGILGAGVSHLFTAKEFDKFSKALEADLAEDTPNAGEISQEIIKRMRAAGAASADEINLDDLKIGGGRAVEAITAASTAIRLNPGLELLTSKSMKSRKIFTDMAESHVGTVGELEGRTAGAAVETSVKQWERGALASFLGDLKTTWKQAKGEWAGTRAEFNEAVAKAARRSDIDPDGNPHVTAAAQSLRTSLLDKMKNEAVDAGLLDAAVKTVTAPSYLHRVWNARRVIGEEARFRSITGDWVRGLVDDALIKQEEIGIARNISKADDLSDSLNNALERVGNVEGRLADRQASRAKKLDLLEKAQSSRLDTLRGRVPKNVIEAAKSAKDGDGMIEAVREVSRAPKAQPKRPMIGLLKDRGGVKIGSPLDGELRAMGVDPKTAPGLFRRDGGLTAVDNFPASEEQILSGLTTDGNGYADPREILEAIRGEMAGSAIRTDDELADQAARDVLEQNVEQWLEEIGLPANATAKQVRDHLNKALKNENRLSDLDQKIARMEGELNDFDSLTDEVSNQKLLADAEAGKFADELNDLEAKINEVREYANASPRVKLMVDYADARKAYAKGKYQQTRLRNRIEAIERVDVDGRAPDEMIAELRALRSDKNAIDERVIKAKHKVEKLKPMLPKDRGDTLDFLSPEDKESHISQIVDGIFNNITGRSAADAPDWIVPITQGPLKGRTFNIPDELIEDFLENDVEMIARRYVRKMAPEVELTRKFGRADMTDQIESIRSDYKAMRAVAKDQKEIKALDKAETRDIRHIEAFRDMIRGTYRAAEEGTTWATATRLALGWNYITKLGGVTLSSLPDMFSVLTRHGLRGFMEDGLPALTSTTRAVRIAKNDARELGAITETILQSRLAELADLHNPYASGTPAERIMNNLTSGFTRLTFLDRWNDLNKTVVSVMTTNKIAKLVLGNMVDVPSTMGGATGKQVSYSGMSKYEKSFLGKLGINEEMATRIADQTEKFGLQENGIWGLNVSKWTDGDARRAFAAALNKEVDGTIVTPGISDRPLWSRSNTGKLIMQFKSFGLASHQRILLSRLQGNPKHLAEFVLLGSLAGMMISYLKLIERGDFEGAERLTKNHGLWIADGFDRTGIASVLMDASNTAEKIGAPFGIKSAAQWAAGDSDRSADISRYASRNKAGALLGPTIGTIQDMATIAAQVSGGALDREGARAITRNIPGGTLPGVRSLVQSQIKPRLVEATE